MEGANPPQNNNNDENRASSEPHFAYSFFRRGPFFSPFLPFRDLSSTREGGLGENLSRRTSLRIISSTYSNVGRNPEYAPQPSINSDEIRETIAQNLLEVQNMIDYGNYNEFNEEKEEKGEKGEKEEKEEKEDKEKKEENKEKEKYNNNIDNNKKDNEEYNMLCFDLNKRILAKGQWVDVKDTVEQWLDAQVIEVSEDNKMVKIHYNHWSSRWDEWIQTNSPRIMPFRYHTRQSTLTNYHSPYPNKKPDMGITLLSFENLNRNSCVHPLTITQPRNRNSAVITSSPPQTQNINPPPPPSQNVINITTSEINLNSNNNLSLNQNQNPTQNTNSNTNSNINNNININIERRINRTRYAEPLPPIPSPKHQEPDPENHIVKNLGEDGFIGVFKEIEQINKVIGGLSSELLNEHNNNTEILTPKKLSEIQNKSYYNLKRLIPILDRTGRIYSDVSTFMEHSMKTNQLELLSKNLFADAGRINEDLKYFSAEERRRVSNDILSHNSRRENRSGTVNFVPPVNKFETKLINSIPIIDTPYMVGKNDSPQIFDFLIQNNNNEEEASSGDENNNNNNNNNNNINRNEPSNSNTNNFIRNNTVERFNIKFEGRNENKEEEGKKLKNNKKSKNIKNGHKMLGIKTKRNKSKKKNEDNKNIQKNENKKAKKKK